MSGYIQIALYILIVAIASVTLGFIGFLGAVLLLHFFITSKATYVDPDDQEPFISSTPKDVVEEEFDNEVIWEEYYSKVPYPYLEAYRIYLKSQEWYALRKKVFKRDSHRCVRCGYIGTEKQCHHTNYRGIETMEFTVDQLETVCFLCHTDIHQGHLPMAKD